MAFQQNIDACLAHDGAADLLPRKDLDALVASLDPALHGLQAMHRDKSLPLFQLPAARADLEPLRLIAQRWRTAFDHVVVLGTGGSSLGGQTLYALADVGFGPSSKERSLGTPRVHFVDNIDPHTLSAMFDVLDLKVTGFIAISKSGKTAETLTQFLIVLKMLRDALDDSRIAKHCLVVTEPGPNPLRRLAERNGIAALDHDPKVGGRYSALSVVGLLPAMIAGLDSEALRAGASGVLAEMLGARHARDCRAAVGAALHVAYMRRGVGISVLMPYVDRLSKLAMWWRQLWAESLGKKGLGLTPAPAVGAIDQHSQLQLYLDGPGDKLFTLLTTATAGQGDPIDGDLADDPDLAWIAERTIGDLMQAEAQATLQTLAKRGRPVRHLRIGRLTETELGGLMMHFMLETILAARLMEVDPFDQPAVEEGKVLARQLMLESAS
ncbi:MAG: glucose-6-phosphate isomerase [Alphaproteobacteria bacterium]|nr:glucose-6-phosphate isomerase [Alphaproteobacteria bacterium]